MRPSEKAVSISKADRSLSGLCASTMDRPQKPKPTLDGPFVESPVQSITQFAEAHIDVLEERSQAVVYDRRIYVAAGSPKRGGGNVNSIGMFSPSDAPDVRRRP